MRPKIGDHTLLRCRDGQWRVWHGNGYAVITTPRLRTALRALVRARLDAHGITKPDPAATPNGLKRLNALMGAPMLRNDDRANSD